MGCVREISNSQLGQIACSQLNIDRQIEDCEVPNLRGKLQRDTDAQMSRWRSGDF